MSAFVVSTAHIDAMVRAGMDGHDSLHWYWGNPSRHEQLTHANASDVGAMLLAENVRSVEYRYSPPGREAIYGEGWETPEQDLPGTLFSVEVVPGLTVEAPEYLRPYRYPLGKVRALEPVAVLKLIRCFEYQSCETDDWKESQAFAYCEALTVRMIHQLPGYDDAPWGL